MTLNKQTHQQSLICTPCSLTCSRVSNFYKSTLEKTIEKIMENSLSRQADTTRGCCTPMQNHKVHSPLDSNKWTSKCASRQSYFHWHLMVLLETIDSRLTTINYNEKTNNLATYVHGNSSYNFSYSKVLHAVHLYTCLCFNAKTRSASVCL